MPDIFHHRLAMFPLGESLMVNIAIVYVVSPQFKDTCSHGLRIVSHFVGVKSYLLIVALEKLMVGIVC